MCTKQQPSEGSTCVFSLTCEEARTKQSKTRSQTGSQVVGKQQRGWDLNPNNLASSPALDSTAPQRSDGSYTEALHPAKLKSLFKDPGKAREETGCLTDFKVLEKMKSPCPLANALSPGPPQPGPQLWSLLCPAPPPAFPPLPAIPAKSSAAKGPLLLLRLHLLGHLLLVILCEAGGRTAGLGEILRKYSFNQDPFHSGHRP